MRKIDFSNIILVILICSSIFLTGSLWFDNYHGLSLVIAELPFWINETFDFNKIEYTEYIKPFKITITNGENGNYSYYAFNEGNYKGVELIKDVVSQIPEEALVEKAFINEWNELQNRKSVICEFGKGIDSGIINSIIPSNKIYTSEIININSIAITKSVEGVIIYIKLDNNDIYRVLINKEIPEFIKYIETYSNKMTYTKLVKLEEMGTNTFYGNKKISQESKVLYPISTKQSNRRFVSEIVRKSFYAEHDMELIEKIVKDFFETYEYTKFVTTDNSYIFIKDDGSTVKFFNDGVFEYTSKTTNEDNESTMLTSFDIALEYINFINGTENIYLLSAIKNTDYYEFEFGINVVDLPVINTECKINDNNKTHIYVQVKNNKVIYYKELLNRYETIQTNSYIGSFGHNILDDILTNVEKDTTVTIEQLELVYDVSSDTNFPVWFAKYNARGTEGYILNVAAKKKNY